MAKIDALSDLCIISSCIKKISTVAVFTEAGKCQTLFSAKIASQIPAAGGIKMFVEKACIISYEHAI